MGAVNTGLIELDAATVAGLMARGEAVVVDVREIHEWSAERIPGAVWRPMSKFEPATWPSFPGRKVVISCLGGIRSAMVADRLMSAGHPWAIHLKGGLNAWKQSGLPVEAGE